MKKKNKKNGYEITKSIGTMTVSVNNTKLTAK